MSRGWAVSRLVTVAAAAVAVVVLPACGGSSSATGGGARVDVCGAYEAYDALPEPDPKDPAKVQAWAAGFIRVMDRTETDEQVADRQGHNHDVPAEVVAAFPHLRAAVKRYQAAVRAAAPKGGVAVAAVADRLAVDDEFRNADATVRGFHDKTCR